MPREIKLPVGRIVWGNPGKSQIKKDQNTKQPIVKDGKNVEQWAFGIAIPEQAFWQEVWPVMDAEARTAFAQGAPQGFSWKYKDGTRGVDKQGKPFNQREGWNGHVILNISTEAFAPPMFRWNGTAYQAMTGDEINTGDFMQWTVTFQVNVPQNRAHTPGLYVNPKGGLFVAYGPRILGASADPTEMFGAAPPQFQLPPGASMTPVAPAPPAAMPGSPGMPPGPPQQMPGQPPMAPPAQYGAPPAAPGYPPQQMPGQPPGPPAPAAAPGYPPQSGPGGYQMQPAPGAPPMAYQPAHDFVQPGAPQAPAPGQYPPGPGAYPPSQQGQPGPGQPSYPPGYPPQAPAPGQYPPGYPPGMPSPR